MTYFTEKTIPLVVITGCTATGKTEIAIEIAKEINGFIINADSKQVYSEIPIATAQPQAESKVSDHWLISGVEHFLFGTCSVYKQYTIQEYQKEVYNLLRSRIGREQVPILVGGSGLYIDAVIKNYDLKDQSSPDLMYRRLLNDLTIKELQDLAGDSLNSLNQSDQSNPVRLIRLIERKEPPQSGPKRKYTYFVIEKERNLLNKRIVQRVETMFNYGLLREAERFKDEIIKEDSRFQIIGIQEFRNYFLGECTLDHVKDLIILHTKQYAKRQRTWFKREKNAQSVKNTSEILGKLKDTNLHNAL